MDPLDLIEHLKALLPADFEALIVSIPEADLHVSSSAAQAERAAALVRWATRLKRLEDVAAALERVAGDGGGASAPPPSVVRLRAHPSRAGRIGSGGRVVTDDATWCQMAVEEAAKCKSERGRVSPKVGCVVVCAGKLLARGHRGELKRGEHAEYTVLDRKLADIPLAGATVYTTLEPCTVRSPEKTPCANRLADARVARVVVGMVDPDPRITGKGILLLRDAGIQVDFFPPAWVKEAESLNRKFVQDRRRRAREDMEKASKERGHRQSKAGGQSARKPATIRKRSVNVKARDGAAAVGKRAVAAGKGGIAIGGNVHGNIVIRKG